MNESPSSNLVVEDRDGIRWLSLQAPRANALSSNLVEGLIEAVEGAPGAGVGALVVCPVGPHLSSGFDLLDLEHQTDALLLHRFVRIEELLSRLRRAPVLTIGIAPGYAVGAGADLLLSCDHRLGTKDTTVRFPGPAFGVLLGRGQQRARLSSAAGTLLLAGGSLRGSDAERTGILTEIIDGGAGALYPLERRAKQLCDMVAWCDPDTRTAMLNQWRPEIDSDRELATLVRSATPAGLKERMLRYVESTSVARDDERQAVP